jgi:hypothetical protein
MKRLLLTLFFCAFSFFSLASNAYEVVDVCATYKNTGKKYKVEARVYSGTELNQKTGSFDYNSFSKYAVIFWEAGQATVIELDLAIGGISPIGSDGKDQRGYPWSLSTSTTFCY